MQNKASLILKRLTNYRRFSTTWGFVQGILEFQIIYVYFNKLHVL